MPSAQDYKFISRERMNKILDSLGETYEPRGLFICMDKVDRMWVYTAVNNLNGDAITDEFITKRSAVRWLHGHPVTDEQRYLQAGEKTKSARRLAEIAKGE